MDDRYKGQASPMNSRYGNSKKDEFNLAEIIGLITRHKFLLLLLLITSMVTATIAHFFYPSYKSLSSINFQVSEVNPLQAVSARLTGLGGDSFGPREIPEKYLQELKSFDFFLFTAKNLIENKEFETIDKKYFLENRLDPFEKLISLISSKRRTKPEINQIHVANLLSSWFSYSKQSSDTLQTSVVSPNQALSLFLVNFITNQAVQYITNNEVKELEDAEKYVQIQLNQAEKAIRETEDNIIDFKKSSNRMALDFEHGDASKRAIEIKRDIEEAATQIAENNKLIEVLSKDTQSQENEIAQQTTGSKPKYGLFQRVNELRRENKYLAVKQNTLKTVLTEIVQSQDPHFEQKLFDFHKKMELEYSLYQELKKQLFQIEMQRIVAQNKVRVFEKAHSFDVKRSLSLKKKILLAVFIALFIGIPSAYFWEMLVPTVKSRFDLEEAGLIFLGAIPDLNAIQGRRKSFFSWHGLKQDTSQLCRFDLDSVASLAFKHLRTRVMHSLGPNGKSPQVLAVLSAELGEGKSFFSKNLAASLAHLKKKVLLIDSDVRRASLSADFAMKMNQGLSEVLANTQRFGEVARMNVASGLDFLPAGASFSGASELISSDRFAELIQDLRSVYDYIIIDTPSLLPPPDAALIARRSDMAIVLASVNKTRKENLDRGLDVLIDLTAQRAFGVLNRVHEGGGYLYAVSNDLPTIGTRKENIQPNFKL